MRTNSQKIFPDLLTPILNRTSIGVMKATRNYQRGERSKRWLQWCFLCGREFKSSRETAMFCCNAHKLKWNRHFKKTGAYLSRHVASLSGPVSLRVRELRRLTSERP